MLRIKSKLFLLFYTASFVSNLAKSQNVVYHIEDNRSVQKRVMTLKEINTPVYTIDSFLIKRTLESINYYQNNFTTAPIKIEGCEYITPAKYNAISKTSKSIVINNYLKFYSDTLNSIDTMDIESEFKMYLKPNVDISKFYAPFYFKKTEVTNKEYKEFVNWVLDSILRQLLAENGFEKYILKRNEDGEIILNKKEKIDYKDSSICKIINKIYLTEEERYYKRKEIDSRHILYKYKNGSNTEIIYVYPDTLCWIKDFTYSTFDYYTNLYFWHPAYDNYPVVGVNQHQANAFLIWKTSQMQKEIDSKKINIKIRYELPSEAEWDIVQSRTEESLYKSTNNSSFYTNLNIKEDTLGIINKPKKIIKETDKDIMQLYITQNINSSQLINRIEPYVFSNDLKSNKKNKYFKILEAAINTENILFINSNVSEWTRDNYKENWLPIFLYHQNKLRKINSAYFKNILITESFYDSRNYKKGVLVIGGNWYDYLLEKSENENATYSNRKIFVDPADSHATIGFRYVVKFEKK
jgi:formylglycine-generating enzyme required for sulfatase activity